MAHLGLIVFLAAATACVYAGETVIYFNRTQDDYEAMTHLKHCILSVADYKTGKNFDRNFKLWYHLSNEDVDEIYNFPQRYRITRCINNRPGDVPLYKNVNNKITNALSTHRCYMNHTTVDHDDEVVDDGHAIIYIALVVQFILICTLIGVVVALIPRYYEIYTPAS